MPLDDEVQCCGCWCKQWYQLRLLLVLLAYVLLELVAFMVLPWVIVEDYGGYDFEVYPDPGSRAREDAYFAYVAAVAFIECGILSGLVCCNSCCCKKACCACCGEPDHKKANCGACCCAIPNQTAAMFSNIFLDLGSVCLLATIYLLGNYRSYYDFGGLATGGYIVVLAVIPCCLAAGVVHWKHKGDNSPQCTSVKASNGGGATVVPSATVAAPPMQVVQAAATLATVTVPSGVAAGQNMQISVGGQTLSIQVPAGLSAGQQFQVSVPQQPQVVVMAPLPSGVAAGQNM
jgi:hypothetical protein